MRTKTLALTAALVAAGVASSMAQSNVYSLNVVGYVNVVTPPGFSIVDNPLDTGSNSTVALFPTAANGSIIYTFTSAGGFAGNVYFNGWANPSTLLNPGTGFFYFNPTANPITNTFVGTVVQGSTTNSLVSGFTLAGSTPPITAAVTATNFTLPAANGTILYTYNSGYTSYVFFNGAWSPSVPTINVGQGFFVFEPSAQSWVQTFNVQ